MEIFQLIRVLILATTSFFVALFLTPFLTRYLYKYRLGKQIRGGPAVPIFSELHKKKAGTPTMGGIIVWATVLLLAGFFFAATKTAGGVFGDLNFISRAQTYLPLAALGIAALFGLVDDLCGIFRFGKNGQGLSVPQKIILYSTIAVVGALWFYFKLDWDTLHIPLFGDYFIGGWYIPLFVFVILASAFSANEADGLDGLAGGVLLIAFVCLGVVAFVLGRYDLTVFTATVAGALVAFLWFNVYPARFFMGDTGSMSLGITLGVIAMLTDTALLLPFFAFVLVGESASVIIQVVSKRIAGKKIFISTPIHHHFEALGWPETKVTMRFWIISGVVAGFGLIIFFLDRFLL
ncbi:MAG: hypothetical protein A2939_01520 [Parcubacteria group bacterium RIFCSPLOWO2_01_FULL_48_18]|nr:MAG: hypothetical protein A2939_01520 [Parcubacteria group bacterium RIFCSPLOWO2_01_FULL_48_18]OHB23544.1 MAG: hypothetical protein A3J67_01125 [Parcubacteria group bacterium RIFCSPHIGHO2_02_FULL_48_10b]